MFKNSLIKLAVLLALLLPFNALAGTINDLQSRTFWTDLSGVTSGSTNQIIYDYLGGLGYTGTLNDRIHAWLVDQTGLSSTISTNDLAYDCFVTNLGCYNGGAGQLTFLGQSLTFLGQSLTFNP